MNGHNHPPRCCCESDSSGPKAFELITCPACVEHGELAQLSECPSCHTTGGHPHTEYCQAPCPGCGEPLGTHPDPLHTPLAGHIEVRDPQPYGYVNGQNVL